MEQSVGVVVPAYDPDVDRLVAYLRTLDAELAPEVLRVELDAPSDAVVDGLARRALPPAVAVNAVDARRGKGAAITAGFEALGTDVLAFADADGSTPAASLARVVDGVAADAADLAVGSRRHPDSTVTSHQTFVRRRLGDVFARLAGHLLEVRLYDYQCGAKAISHGGWERVRGHLYEPGFAWDVELVAVAAALGLRVAEVPVEWEDHADSTVSPLSTAVELGRGVLAARHRVRLLRDHPLHATIDAYREETALVDRVPPPGD